ncbi:MAG: ABC transporter substrate-binding protein [Chitinophagales bacterium]
MRKLLSISAVALALFMAACNGGSKGQEGNGADANKKDRSHVKSDRAGLNEVVIHLTGDPDKLNPLTYTAADAGYIVSKMFMQLEDIDPDSFSMFGQLAVGRPELKLLEDGPYKGGLSLTYELRPEAKWDNGTPVTADDVIFSIKAVKNPKTDCEQQRPYFDALDDIQADPSNNRKFVAYFKDRYFMSEYSLGLFPILPEYHYDPDKIMRKFTIHDLTDKKKSATLKGNADIIKFADYFNSEKLAREHGFIVGCGPYEFDQWVTGQRITVKRKQNWWGDALKDVNADFVARPEKITYEVINDINAATAALKGEKLDVLDGMKAKDFQELSADDKMTDKYNFHKPVQLSYSYIGINMRKPTLSDVRVRKALAHCLDVDMLIKKISLGMATRVTGPIHYTKPYYNKDLQPVPFDVTKANALLDEAGWTERDAAGIRQKTINGKKEKLSLEFKYFSGSDVVEKIALLFQENCKKAGVEITFNVKEPTVFQEDVHQHKFDLFYYGWIASPTPDDEKQIWHTESYNGGSNYVGFGDQKSDALIDSIRFEQNEAVRNDMYKRFQQMVYDAQPYIFMSSPLNRMAIHARFNNADPKIARPGYVETLFTLDKTFGSKATANAQ